MELIKNAPERFGPSLRGRFVEWWNSYPTTFDLPEPRVTNCHGEVERASFEIADIPEIIDELQALADAVRKGDR